MRILRMGILTGLLFFLTVTQAEGTLDTFSSDLRKAVTQEGLLEHLQTFQAIADANGGNRSAGSAGYDASIAYVQEQLLAAGYNVTLQEFEVDSFEILAAAKLESLSNDLLSLEDGTDITTMNLSTSGEVTARVQAVDVRLSPDPNNSSTSGCEAADFEDFSPGSIALLQRGTCTFQVKVDRAEAAGASAVIIFNEGQRGRRDVFGGSLSEVSTIPVLSASFELGETLADTNAEFLLATDTLAEVRTTHNLIAETQGDPNRAIMIGGHLDSVPNGPGIHDNGSGSAAILEIALQIAKLYDAGSEDDSMPSFRFAWWGGEELGLLGSRHYVESLSEEEKKSIKAYLNLDMIGSPNFVRFVYDGDESDQSTNLPLPEGTAEIEQVFLDYFADETLITTPVAVFSRSDHDPFARAGIAIGGLFTGAEGTKSNGDAERYGGTAGEPFDACYHRACDTVENVDLGVLEQMADAAAHALVVLASDPPKR